MKTTRYASFLLCLLMIASMVGGCGRETYSNVTPDATSFDSASPTSYTNSQIDSVNVQYAQDIQPLTGGQSCKACHQGGGSRQLALGTYQVDSQVNATSLRRMLVSHGSLSSAQLAKVDAWLQAGRPNTMTSSTASSVVNTPLAPTPTPAPVQNPPGPDAAFTYAQDIQPLTSSQACKACHQGGGARQLALGTYQVDSQVKVTSLRSMLVTHGSLSSAQLAKVDAWIKAGRPESAATPVGTPSVPLPDPSFQSPHFIGWKYLHGFDVKLSGGYKYAHIKKGGSCINCHTTEKQPDGTIPQSPGAKFTCFSCHNGPTGKDY